MHTSILQTASSVLASCKTNNLILYFLDYHKDKPHDGDCTINVFWKWQKSVNLYFRKREDIRWGLFIECFESSYIFVVIQQCMNALMILYEHTFLYLCHY